MQNPMISIILPVYNSEKYLDNAIESILLQSFTNFELILINDGSTDLSLEIMLKWKSNDNRIIIIDRQNKGLIFSLDEGINLAKGKYIARMDADDISLPDRLALQYNFMESNNLDICGGHFLQFTELGHSNLIQVPTEEKLIALSLVSQVPFAHPSVMIRKEFLLKNKLSYGSTGFKNAEDLALWTNIYNFGGKFGNVNNTILKYRIVVDSLSRRNRKNLIKDTRIINKNFFLQNKEILNDYFNSYKSNLYLSDLELKILYCYSAKYFFTYKKILKPFYFKGSNIKLLIKPYLREIKIALGY